MAAPGFFHASQSYQGTTIDTLTADLDDLDPGPYTVLRVACNSPFAITGLSGGAKDRPLWIINVGTENLSLNDEDDGSFRNNRITIGFDATTPGILTTHEVAHLWYDDIDFRWRVLK